jgi:hypothetical protein
MAPAVIIAMRVGWAAKESVLTAADVPCRGDVLMTGRAVQKRAALAAVAAP